MSIRRYICGIIVIIKQLNRKTHPRKISLRNLSLSIIILMKN